MGATFRLVEFPAEAFTSGLDLDDASGISVWMIIVVSSLVAGIGEEVGFRGYMQVPLETRYSPAIAITVCSVFFALIHLVQPWATAVLPHLFGLSVLLGILAYASQSLIPVVIAHTAVDIFNFSYWWSDVAGSFQRLPISETGMDFHFVAWIVVLAVGIGVFAWALRRLLPASIPTRT